MKETILIVILIGVLIISGCAQIKETPKEVMNIGKYYWPGQFWITIADKKGWFEEEGLNAVVEQVSEDYLQTLQGLTDGKIDVYQCVLYDVVSSRGIKLKIIFKFIDDKLVIL